jgi:hypothetical protein
MYDSNKVNLYENFTKGQLWDSISIYLCMFDLELSLK